MRGMYRDGASLRVSSVLSKDWWTSQRFFWERTLSEIPHCVVFVFDGSSDPFLDSESLGFFKDVFEDCAHHGMFNVVSRCIYENILASHKIDSVLSFVTTIYYNHNRHV